MKLRPTMTNSTRPQIFDNYEHPWYKHVNNLKRPNPPTTEAVKRAKFVDKTYKWQKSN